MESDIGPIAARREIWQQALRKIQTSPLAFCPDFPEITRRWNRWWRFEADRPLLIAATAVSPAVRADKAFDLLELPQEWLRVRRAQLQNTHRVGDALPQIRVDIGPVALAAFLGAPLHFALKEQTAWQDPVIESWEADNPYVIDPANAHFCRVLEFLELVAEDARGRYLVCLPDLSGAIDALANLRGSQRLCLDLFDNRTQIRGAAAQVVDAWEFAFASVYAAVVERGAGLTQFVSCWSESPFTVPTCDFNALVSPDDFAEICLPSLEDQARRAGRCCFHLDGPDAARHAGSLARTAEITAIQYTPGAATPSALDQLPMFRMIQKHRKPLFIETPAAEVKALAAALDPAGLAIRVGNLPGPGEADALHEWLSKRY